MNWNKFYESGELGVVMPLTNRCNAECPQCDRTINVDKIPDIEIDLETFKKRFPIEVLRKLRYIDFTGPHGDAVASPHFFEICEYIVKESNTPIHVNTNGSLRSENFWWELGSMCKEQLTVTFDIDGITQEMHSKYRRNTNLEKILSNMKTLSQTPSIIYAYTVVFKHNQNYLKEIEQLCLDNGAQKFEYSESNRFPLNSSKQTFTDSYGKNYTLEKVIATDIKTNCPSRTKQRSLKTELKSIECYWYDNKNISISIDGNVAPCCHWNMYYLINARGDKQEPINNENFKMLLSNECCLDNNSLEKILNNNFYTKYLYDSIKDPNNAEYVCRWFCGK